LFTDCYSSSGLLQSGANNATRDQEIVRERFFGKPSFVREVAARHALGVRVLGDAAPRLHRKKFSLAW
jgi:hypothetical protein